MLIDGGGDENVETSSLEASNLIVLRVSTLSIRPYGIVFLASSTRDIVIYFSSTGIINYSFKCKSGSSWARFIKFDWTRRLHRSSTSSFVIVL